MAAELSSQLQLADTLPKRGFQRGNSFGCPSVHPSYTLQSQRVLWIDTSGHARPMTLARCSGCGWCSRCREWRHSRCSGKLRLRTRARARTSTLAASPWPPLEAPGGRAHLLARTCKPLRGRPPRWCELVGSCVSVSGRLVFLLVQRECAVVCSETSFSVREAQWGCRPGGGGNRTLWL